MPVRDPETGKFVSNGGTISGLTYADHDVHHIKHQVNFLSSADAGPTTEVSDIQQWEITERGLDPDELAELRAMRVSATVGAFASPIDQDEIGGVNAKIGAGFNLSEGEFLWTADGAAEGQDVDASGTDDFNVVTADTDEPGELYHTQVSAYPGYSDTTDGTGGAGGMPTVTDTIAFEGLTGTGPIVDAVDDFSTLLEFEVRNMVANVAAWVDYTLWYAVEESESGRTRFGR